MITAIESSSEINSFKEPNTSPLR